MIRTPSAAAVRRVAVHTTPLIHAVVLYLLCIGHAAAAAVVAVVDVALLTVLLGLSHHRAVRAERRVNELGKELAVAHTDPVTGLAVRRIAERCLVEAAGTPISVALVDVDDMHGINDAHTHDGGDVFLAAVAERLTHAAEPGDLVARLGGDEFVVITRRDPHVLERALGAMIQAPVTIDNTTLPIQVSIGICRVPGGDPHTALGRADRAMFTAKRRRSGIAHYDAARDGVPLSPGVRPPVRHRDRRPAGHA